MNYKVGILLCILIFNTIPPLLAQPDLSRKISIKATELPLEKVLDEISEKSGIIFSYNSRKLPLDQPVSLQAENETVEYILQRLTDELGLDLTLVEEQVVLKLKKSPQVVKPTAPQIHTLYGYLKDLVSGEVLIGATVYVKELFKGTVSNAFGFYSLSLPAGDYTVSYSYMGYKTTEQKLGLNADRVMDIRLEEVSALLEEVVVSYDDDQLDLRDIQTSQVNIKPAAIEKMPAFMGEVDVIKSLQSIPGISLQGDGSTLFYVRGGNKDQNLILLDDAPIYNPSHFLGIFSTIIPEVVKDVSIYKGDIPAEYGGRLSSLIDIRTKDGDMNAVKINGSFGLITAKTSVQGPILKNKSSFFISGRSSYIKWFLRQINPNLQDFHFNDLNAKFNIRLGTKDRLFLSGYTGKDFFSQGTSSSSSGISWKNLAGTIRWNHLFSSRLFVNTTLRGSSYDYYLLTNVDRNDAWHTSISNTGLKTDFTLYYSPALTTKFGAELTGHKFNPGNYEPGNGGTAPGIPYVSHKNANEINLYASNLQQISEKISIRYGLRLSTWQNQGPSTEYVYDTSYFPVETIDYGEGIKYYSSVNLEPRFGFTWQINAKTSLKSGYARTTQYLQLITNSISPFTTLEVWLPSGPNIKPQTADQISAGIFRKFPGPKLEFSLEGYYKKMNNQIDYRDHARMLLNPYLESELRFGRGWSYGLEVLLKKQYGKLNGWIGYAWSRSYRKINNINGDMKYPAPWDRPHDLSCYLSYHINQRWTVSTNWFYMTGAPFSSPSGFYYYNGHSVPVYTSKNNDRLPDYHRLDLSAEYRLNKIERKYQHTLLFTIYNLCGRKNPLAVNFNKTLDDSGEPAVPGNLYQQPQLVPTQMYLFGMVPAISYRFSFR